MKPMGVNVEIKARASDAAHQRTLAAKLSDTPCERIDQEDTFFDVPRGLLKLRKFAEQSGELIQYDRAVETGPKTSRYSIVQTQDPNLLCKVLSASHSVVGVIKKQRYLYTIDQTRIHFDAIDGLGWYIELETVLREGQSEESGRAIVSDLMQKLEIRDEDLIETTYLDLLLAQHGGRIVSAQDAEQRASRSTERYRDMLEAIPLAVQEIDSTGVILFCNKAWYELLGIEYGTFTGRNFLEVLESDEERDKVRDYLSFLVREQPEPTPYFDSNRTKDGRLIDLQVDWTYKRDDQGKVVGFISVISDPAERRKVEDALRDTERQYHDMFDAVADAVFVNDLDLKIIDVNPAACALYGYSRDEFLGQSVEILIHDRDRHVIPLGVEATEAGRPALIEHRSRRKDGTEFVVEALLSPFVYKGRPHILAALRDITERKQAEEKIRETSATMERMIEEQNALLDHTRDFVYRHNKEGVFNYLAPSVEQVTGYRVDEWWKHYSAYMTDHPINEKVDAYTEEALRTGRESPPYCVELWHKKGHRVMLEVCERPYFENGKVAGIIGVARDVTERAQAEVELQKEKENAEMANRAKGAFLANISHEIRTPMMAILAAAERLGGQLNQTADSYRDTILRNGQHLVSLFDDLLDAARMEAGKLSVAPSRCSLLEIMSDVKAMTALHVKDTVEFRIVYESSIPNTIHTDARRLRQAVLNLVNNALKFTNEGRVYVHVRVETDQEEPMLSIAVEDSGIGVPMESLDLVFEPFGQVNASDIGLAEGVGLGLPITKWITEQLGGDIELESDVGHGSTFTIRIGIGSLDDVEWFEPGALPKEAEVRPRGHARQGTRLHGRILLAEDSKDVRELMQEALSEAGAEVTAVGDGQEAVEVGKREAYDLILLDLHMPGLDGLSAASELRRHGCLAAMIAVTAWTEPSEQARIFKAGFDDLWPKPLSVQHVVRQAASYLDTIPTGSEAKSQRDHHQTHAPATQVRLEEARRGFVDTLGSRAARVRRAVDTGDFHRAGEILHQLVGSAGICGYAALSKEAARLLALANEQTLSSRTRELDELEELVRSIAKSQHGGKVTED